MNNKLSKILVALIFSLGFILGSCKTSAKVTYYTITYSSEYDTAPEAKTVKSGYVLTSEDLPVLSDSSKIFSGWYIDSVYIEEGLCIEADITLTAKWDDPIGSKMTPSAVGDVVFIDGSSAPAPKYNTFNAEQKSKVIGVVALIVKDDNNNDVYLLAGMETYYDIPWAIKGAGCYDTTPEDLTPEGDSYGPNNWKKIVADDPVYTTEENWETYYPAFYKAMNHGIEKGYTGRFRTGWYLPSVGELKRMFENYDTYKTSIAYSGGKIPYASDYSLNAKNEKIYSCKYLYSSNGINNTAYAIEPGNTDRYTTSNNLAKMVKDEVNGTVDIYKSYKIGVLPVYRYSVK